ncbi:GrpB family protein [Vreelandella venusta]|uniref:GrpB family protein n=1 Tax=Vreelandella venusta TaxID=44935 RepID=UPI003C2D99E4
MIDLQRSNDWGAAFLSEASRIRSAVGDVALQVHHIGSTAIPGMAAKPVIDMVLEVSSIDELASSDQALVSLGYESLGENGLSGRRFYRKGGDQRTHHIHAYESGHPDIHRHLVFRDYLRAHKDKATHYEQVKLKAARKFRESPDDYAEAKSPTIQLLENEAMLWARS